MTESFYNEALFRSGQYSLFFIVFTIIIGLKQRTYWNIQFKTIFFYLVFDFLIVISMQLMGWLTNHNGNYWQPFFESLNINNTNCFAILSYFHILILGVYFSTAIPSKKAKIYTKYLSIFLFLIIAFDYFFFTGYNNYSSFSQTILAIYGLILPSIHLWYIYRDDSKVALNKNPYFWISLGLLLPNIMTLWLELFGSTLYDEDFILFCQVSIGNSVFYCISMMLIARGFYFARYAKYLS